MLAWKADNGLELTPDVSVEDWAEMEKSAPRPISAERASATVAEVKESSGIARLADNGKKIAAGVLASVGVSKGADETGLLDKAQRVTDKAQQAQGIVSTARDIVSPAVGFIADYSTPILLFAVLVLGVVCVKTLNSRVKMHQNGEAL